MTDGRGLLLILVFLLPPSFLGSSAASLPESLANIWRLFVGKRSHGDAPPRLAELVVVLPSSDARQALVEASRSWRGGVRTFVATNSSPAEADAMTRQHSQHLETYMHIADEVPEPGKKPCA